MKIKTQDLTGEVLDLAVAESVGLNLYIARLQRFSPSTNWAQGGPIIEREGIALYLYGDNEWNAHTGNKEFTGPTPLIAAMRCYVASKLGEELDIPEELA